MKFLEKFNLDWPKVLKTAGVVLVGIIILSVVFRFLGFPGMSVLENRIAPQSIGYKSYDEGRAYGGGGAVSYDGAVMEMAVPSATSGSIRPEPVSGNDAESFEVTEYSVTVETRSLDPVCESILDLKKADYIIFENASEYDHGCNYTFKVKNDHVEEILDFVDELDPKEFTETTYTIKKQIQYYTDETEILKKKMASIDETLNDAIAAYENITSLATRIQDVESLAKIIDSKVQVIERLTQERINITAQLDRLEKSKAEQLDRLEYTYFYLNVSENKFIDLEDIKDSWKAAVKSFFTDVNGVIQEVTIGLLVFLFFVFQYVVYAFILFVVLKYGVKFGKYIWKK